ncbi:MAG: aspartate-semialdehyde dehydrogenase [Tissierellia bacterium]|nr:aspartate-semialdehyde dehydrogenase [Tissierellia bacterium]
MKKVIVVGATGLVGSKIIEILEQKKFPIKEIKFLASKNSAGEKIKFNDEIYEVKEVLLNEFEDYDIALFAAGSSVSEKFARNVAKMGVRVIDNSSFYRMERDVPLIVPEVNPDAIGKNDYLIANPNCSTIQCMAPLYQIEKNYGIKRVVYSTYQSVSGSGLKGLRDLDESLSEFYPYPIKNNALPHIDIFLENGYTKEEMKMVNETRKILGIKDLPITATTVRIPVRFGHAVSINVETKTDFNIEDVKSLMDNKLGMELKDDLEKNIYPMPIEAEGKDPIYVGRIRRDFSVKYGLNLWTVADNIRKGAALNAVQIAQLIERKGY